MRAAGRSLPLPTALRIPSSAPPPWSARDAGLSLPWLRAEPRDLHLSAPAAVPPPHSPPCPHIGTASAVLRPGSALVPPPLGACGAARPFSSPTRGRPGAPGPEHDGREGGNALPGLDWAFLRASFRALPSVLLDLLLPDSPAGRYGEVDPRRARRARKGWFGWDWYAGTASVESAYRRSLRGVTLTPGRLVRGIVYEMSALMVPAGGDAKARGQGAGAGADAGAADGSEGLSEEEAEKLRNAELARRDWQGFLMGMGTSGASADSKDKAEASKDVTRGITVDELADQLGMPAVVHEKLQETRREPKKGPPRRGDAAPASAGLLNSGRVTPPSAGSRKERDFEELLAGGRGDSIRSKYMARIKEKQMLAEASVARGARPGDTMQGGWVPKAKQPASSRTWLLTPGGAGILRHFKERLLHQALLVTQPSSDLIVLTDDIGGFQFNPILQNEAHEFSIEDLYRTCQDWNVPPKEVLVVLGAGPHAESLYKHLQGSAFFTCHLRASGDLGGEDGAKSAVTTASQVPTQHRTDATFTTREASPRGTNDTHLQGEDQGGGRHRHSSEQTGASFRGPPLLCAAVQWFRDLSGPAASSASSPRRGVHFALRDMFDLKNVVEDLNGISYRSSTFVRAKGR